MYKILWSLPPIERCERFTWNIEAFIEKPTRFLIRVHIRVAFDIPSIIWQIRKFLANRTTRRDKLKFSRREIIKKKKKTERISSRERRLLGRDALESQPSAETERDSPSVCTQRPLWGRLTNVAAQTVCSWWVWLRFDGSDIFNSPRPPAVSFRRHPQPTPRARLIHWPGWGDSINPLPA